MKRKEKYRKERGDSRVLLMVRSIVDATFETL